ncbi:hypothetical protein H0W26_04145, partial [Candidatus Dependentiae bacterium]|nr:hypothetical protein [Candidatus Dependentiae bacterium]
KTVRSFAANFSKGLEHDPVTGLLTAKGQENYKKLVKAIFSGRQADFNAIQRSPGSLKFVNPQGAYTFSLAGVDSAAIPLPFAPHLSSPEMAANHLELYLMALCRDVSFNEYGTGNGTDANGLGGSLTGDAAAYLQSLGSTYTGPRNAQGLVTPSVLFRCNFSGSLIGPYVSQFLLKPLSVATAFTNPPTMGLVNLIDAPFLTSQTQAIAKAKRDFGLSFSDFIKLQNGTIPVPYSSTDYDPSARRFIINGRDMASYAHFDHPYGPFLNAFNVILTNNFPLSPTNPYVNGSITNEGSFFSLGWSQLENLLGGVSLEALKAAWAHKWRGQRLLRPEALGGLIDRAVSTGTNPFNLDSSLFVSHAGINLLDRVQQYNQQQGAATFLLSQAYPEGAPLHPSYPGGHAVLAAACITVIKAFFDNTVKITARFAPVKPDPADPAQLIPLVNEGENDMTVASELDKLVCNVPLGRNFAGIHWRCDTDAGIYLGEQVALRFLQDQAAMQTEETFTGFIVTKFDGTIVRITATSINPV